MKILVIGQGAREHALAYTLQKQGNAVFCMPGNAGIREIAEPFLNDANYDFYDFDALIARVKEAQFDLTVVGPETFLEKGIANAFRAAGLPLFGPTKEAARLETSKAYAKNFMSTYGIPTASFTACNSYVEALQAAQNMLAQGKGVVVKPSGLTGGKGVVCAETEEEVQDALEALFEESPFSEVVIEEKLQGKEISLLAFCDGNHFASMLPAQDHKRLYDNDEGPNTGGMGAYAPVPFVTSLDREAIQSQVVDKTLEGLLAENICYQGVLFFGLMLTSEGPKVLEYNCRFGDPETQVLLPLLESDLASLMMACLEGSLHRHALAWKAQSACTIVMASKGYPGPYPTGSPIRIDSLGFHEGQILFHAGTKRDSEGNLLTAGGRVFAMTGVGNTLEEALQNGYEGVEKVCFHDAHYRKDIAHQALIGSEICC